LYIKEDDIELGDIVEVVNVNGLNRIIYGDYFKGNSNLIGFQGKVIMIDNTTCKNCTYYFVDLPVGKLKISNEGYIVDGRTIFLEENLKLIKKGDNDAMLRKKQLLNELEQIKCGTIVKFIFDNGLNIIGEVYGYDGDSFIELLDEKYNIRLIRKNKIVEYKILDKKVDNTSFFNLSNIKSLDYKDLDGKTLKMTVVDNDECLLVAGIDKETNTIYMLHSEVK
jgi:predicted Zn-ribbon and HTH transcriptional regulator